MLKLQTGAVRDGWPHVIPEPTTIEQGLPEELRHAAAALYWEAFRAKLGPILSDTEGPYLLAETFNSDRVVIARRGPQLIGLAGLQFGGRAFVGITWSALRRRYGVGRGLVKYGLLALLDRTNLPGQLLMDGIVVAASARGRGVGTLLLDAVEEVAVAAGLRAIRLDVVDTNPDARRLYERRGFQATATTNVPWLRRWMGFGASTTMVKSVAQTPEPS